MKKELLEKALARRRHMRWNRTDAIRILDERGDDCPGYIIESYAGHWVVQTRDVDFPNFLRRWQPEECRSLWWKQLERENKQAPQWVWGERRNEPFLIQEN